MFVSLLEDDGAIMIHMAMESGFIVENRVICLKQRRGKLFLFDCIVMLDRLDLVLIDTDHRSTL